MELFSIILIVTGLILFETISSIDNAVINAEVLSTISVRARKWFLSYGLLFAVFVVRELTVSNIDRVKKYIYLKNGAMYSIFFLGIIMVLDSFGFHIKERVSPIITISVIGYFFCRSKRCL